MRRRRGSGSAPLPNRSSAGAPSTLDFAARNDDVGAASDGRSRVLGLSLGKILLTILVIVVVWKGFALVGRLARERREALAQKAGQRRPARRAQRGTVDLVRCARCGAYFDPAEACRCGHGGP